MMLANNPKKAIIFYEKYLQDSLLTAGQKSMTAYTLARLYTKAGKTAEALKWLETAISNGFNYAFVLENDADMNELRKTQKWKVLIKNLLKKGYGLN